jgi:SOS response associated peptidase (SRAP)
MCGRYRRTTQEEELARLYHIPIPKQTDLPISYNIAPSQKVLTIRFNPETRARSLDALEWGLIPYWAKDPKISYRTINARAETIDKAHFFARYLTYRCPLQPEDHKASLRIDQLFFSFVTRSSPYSHFACPRASRFNRLSATKQTGPSETFVGSNLP